MCCVCEKISDSVVDSVAGWFCVNVIWLLYSSLAANTTSEKRKRKRSKWKKIERHSRLYYLFRMVQMCGWESNNSVQVYQFSNQLIKSYNNDFGFDISNWCVRGDGSLCKRTPRTYRQKRNTERIRESVQTHVYCFKQYVYTDTAQNFGIRSTKWMLNTPEQL